MTADVRFDGRVVVVSDAGTDIGRAIAALFGERGASVVANDVAGDGHDPAQPDGAQAIVGLAMETFGRLDVVVSNTAADLDVALEELTGEQMIATWLSPVAGAFNLLKAAWEPMTARRYGRFVNVGSPGGFLLGRSGRHLTGDVAAGSLAGISRPMATDGEAQGILVNTVQPTCTLDGRGAASTADLRAISATVALLSHESCTMHGRFFAAGAGRVGEVFTSVATGYQCPDPASFALEHVRDNWAAVTSTDGSVAPTSSAEYTAFRTAVFQATVDQAARRVASDAGGVAE